MHAYGMGGQGGAVAPPPIRAVCRHQFGQRVDIIRTKHNTCLINTSKFAEIRFGWGNKGDVHRVLLYNRQKIGSAIVHYFFFLPGGPLDEQFAFANQAKLSLTPQMAVGPYAYACMHARMHAHHIRTYIHSDTHGKFLHTITKKYISVCEFKP